MDFLHQVIYLAANRAEATGSSPFSIDGEVIELKLPVTWLKITCFWLQTNFQKSTRMPGSNSMQIYHHVYILRIHYIYKLNSNIQ